MVHFSIHHVSYSLLNSIESQWSDNDSKRNYFLNIWNTTVIEDDKIGIFMIMIVKEITF